MLQISCIKIKCISASYTCMDRCAVHKVDVFHVGGRKDFGVGVWVGWNPFELLDHPLLSVSTVEIIPDSPVHPFPLNSRAPIASANFIHWSKKKLIASIEIKLFSFSEASTYFWWAQGLFRLRKCEALHGGFLAPCSLQNFALCSLLPKLSLSPLPKLISRAP